jgi:D-threonine aldolase
MLCMRTAALTARTRVRVRAMASSSSAATPLADRPPARVGQAVSSVETPALMVDLDAFDRNVARLRARAAAYPGLGLRPHFKAHKTPELAVRVAQGLGRQCVGLACQKVGEVECALAAGPALPGTVLLTNEVVCPTRLARLAACAAAHPGRVGLAVDSREGVEAASAAAAAAGARLGVVVDADAGQARCGVVGGPAAVADLARAVLSQPSSLDLWGVQAYHGGIQHVREIADRRAAVARVAEVAASAAAAVREVVGNDSTPPPLIVTGGGTGTWALDAEAGALTEVQPGSFVFHDADYARNAESWVVGGEKDGQNGDDGKSGGWEQSLWVLTQVMSTAPGRAVVDAGLKAVDVLSGPPIPVGPGGTGGLSYAGAGDEHGILRVEEEGGTTARPPPPAGGCGSDWPAGALPPLGAKVWLQPSHCDPTVNLYDWIVGVRGGVVEGVWRVAARGPGV